LYNVEVCCFSLFTFAHFCHTPRTVFLQASGISHVCIQLEIFTIVTKKRSFEELSARCPLLTRSCLKSLVLLLHCCTPPSPISDYFLIVLVLLLFIVLCIPDTSLGWQASVQFKKLPIFFWNDNSTTLWSSCVHRSLQLLLSQCSWSLWRCGDGRSPLTACHRPWENPGAVGKHPSTGAFFPMGLCKICCKVESNKSFVTESEKREHTLSFKDSEGWQTLCSDPFIFICLLLSFLCFLSYLVPDIMQTNPDFYLLFFGMFGLNKGADRCQNLGCLGIPSTFLN